MQYNYEKNTTDCNVTYHRNKIGNNYFVVYYKNMTCIRRTPKEVGRVFGIAKFTPFVNELRDWCYQMIDKYESKGESDGESSECTDKGG